MWSKNTNKKIIGVILSIIIVALNFSPQIQGISQIPSEIKVLEGNHHTFDFNLPLNVCIESDKSGIIKINDGPDETKKVNCNLSKPLNLSTISKGKVNLEFKIFGIIPLKRITLNVIPEIKLVPGGQSIGVSLFTKGALVVGVSDIQTEDGKIYNPAEQAGILPGDVIEQVEEKDVKDADHLSDIINKKDGKPINLGINREGKRIFVSITPAKDANDKQYRLGLWVRDSTMGVGTLTFYEPKSNIYGALGHAITDMDTGSILSVQDGEIVNSQVISIIQGEKGKPGEIKGVFSGGKDAIGDIKLNTIYGIYGSVYSKFYDQLDAKALPIMLQSEVKEGPAKILSTIDDTGVREFDVEIIKTVKQDNQQSKGMVIKIVDQELLKKTGGIVQGMSGSPIIQDNKIVGAITHVFINDPSKGYGIYIEWMLKEAENKMAS